MRPWPLGAMISPSDIALPELHAPTLRFHSSPITRRMNLPIRPRRNRRTAAIRDLVRETELTAAHLVYPLFLHAGTEDQPIESMPGCKRWTVEGLVKEAGEAHQLGIPAVVLFPAIANKLKTRDAREAWNAKGLVPRAILALKTAHPTLTVITDVALDPYNADGPD